MNWDEVKELAPLYVIGALDAKTASAVEESLREAPDDLQREIAQWHEVAALLPQSLPLQTPPSYLKDRLMSRIASELNGGKIDLAVEASGVKEADASWKVPFEPVEIETGESSIKEKEEIEEIPGRAEKKVLPFVRPRWADTRSPRWLLIAATALLAFTSAYLYGQNAELARERQQISQELDSWKRKVDEIVAPTTKVISMAGGGEIPGANAKVIWDTKVQKWVIYVFNLPAPPSDKVYQLWYITNKSAKISANVFSTDDQGRTILRLELPPEALAGLAATAVTIEPKGGSLQPTSKPIMIANL